MQISNPSTYSQKIEKNFQNPIRTPLFGAKLLEFPNEILGKIGDELNVFGKTQDLISLADTNRRLRAVIYGTEGSPGPLRKRLRMKAFYQVLKSFFNKDRIARAIMLTNSEIRNAFKANIPKDRKNPGESIYYFNQLKRIMRKQNKLETIEASSEWAGYETGGRFGKSNVKAKLSEIDNLPEHFQAIPTRAYVSLVLNQLVSKDILEVIEHFLNKNARRLNTGLDDVFGTLENQLRWIHPSERKDAIINFSNLVSSQEGPELFKSVGLSGAAWLGGVYVPSRDKVEVIKHIFNLSKSLKSKQDRKLVNDALRISANQLSDLNLNQRAQLQALFTNVERPENSTHTGS